MDLVGLLDGDLNGDFVRLSGTAPAFDDTLALSITVDQAEREGQFLVSLSVEEALTLRSLQLTVQYDAGQHTFESIHAPAMALFDQSNWSHHLPEEGKITYCWYSQEEGVSLEKGTAFLAFILKNRNTGSAFAPAGIKLSPTPTPPEAYASDHQGQALARLHPQTGAALHFDSSTLALQINPVPAFQEDLAIQLGLKENKTLSLCIYDTAGRKILDFYKEATLDKGLYAFSIAASQLAAGTYYLYATSPEEEQVREFVIF